MTVLVVEGEDVTMEGFTSRSGSYYSPMISTPGILGTVLSSLFEI